MLFRSGKQRDSPVLACHPMQNTAPNPGRRSRELRECRYLTLRDVASESARIAIEQGDSRFELSATGLSRIESNAQTPSLYHHYSLTCIHELDFEQVLSWYLHGKSGTNRMRESHA